MRSTYLVLALTVGLGRLAAAQPTPSEPPVPEPTPEPAPPPAPTPPPAPAPPPPPPPPVVHHDAVEEDHGVRPVGWAFGIGIGYALPTSLETPNTASVRFRMPSGLTLEPRVALANNSTTNKDVAPGTSMSTTDTTTEFQLSTAIRKPMIEHGRYDFELLGTVGLDVTKQNPDGDNNTRTDSSIGIGWGIAVGAWITPHWQLTFGVTNPLITYTSTKQETGAGTYTQTSGTDIGITFDPNVLMMIHLYD